MSSKHPYRVTALARSATGAEAITAHWKEYLMESAELGAFMLSTCICGFLIYSNQSPLNSFALTPMFESSLMGIAMATTVFLVIQSPFGRRSGAHFNPAVTLTFFWLGRMHRWDAAFYIAAQFSGAVAGVVAARAIVGLPLSAPPVQYMVTLPGKYGGA